jgi:transcriptional regulator with XRE-family HTH domain
MNLTQSQAVKMSLEELHFLKKVLTDTLVLMNKGEREKLTKNALTEHLRRQLKDTRKNRGWSQEDMAQKIGIDRARYCRLETGKASISLAMSIRMANVLDCAVELSLVPFESVIQHRLQQMGEITSYSSRRSSYERIEIFIIQELQDRGRSDRKVPVARVEVSPERAREIAEAMREEERKVSKGVERWALDETE